MKCPQCTKWTLVKETRTAADGISVRRRHECANGHRFTTLEQVVVLKLGRPPKVKCAQ